MAQCCSLLAKLDGARWREVTNVDWMVAARKIERTPRSIPPNALAPRTLCCRCTRAIHPNRDVCNRLCNAPSTLYPNDSLHRTNYMYNPVHPGPQRHSDPNRSMENRPKRSVSHESVLLVKNVSNLPKLG